MTANKRHAGETAKDNGKNEIAIQINETAYQWEKCKGELRELQKMNVAILAAVWKEIRPLLCELQKMFEGREQFREELERLSANAKRVDRLIADMNSTTEGANV